MASIPFSERVAEVVQLEYGVIVFLGSFIAWIFYKTALRKVNPQRHQSLQEKFRNLAKHLCFLFLFSVPYFLLEYMSYKDLFLEKAIPYLGLVVLFCGTLSILKLTRIAVLEFLFLGHMKEGVPLLIVNIFTLLLSLGLFGWYLSVIFQIQLMPLLATSAVASLVLGLALQDTISNLFAGLGIQFDGSYQIGDWLEVFYQNQKWAGQVEEITWRSTTLVSLTDEIVIIPNKAMSQALIHNFTNTRLFLRNQLIKVDYRHPQDHVRRLLLECAHKVEGISNQPLPLVLIWEMNESYVVYKLCYSINDFGRQFLIADKLLSEIFEALQRENIPIAQTKLNIEGTRA